MRDYSKGKIYKLVSPSTGKVYIGSTITTLKHRFNNHKSDYKTQRRYVSSFEVITENDCYIELVKNYPCSSKKELEREEGKEIQKHTCVNISVAGRTSKEYREQNKEKLAKNKKEWAQKNKERVKENKKRWASENKEHLRNLKRAYNKKNKEKIAQQKRDYFQKNKEKMTAYDKEYKRAKIECECGTVICRGDISRHKRTKKHKTLLETKQKQ